jgi:hypothetical protein
MFKGSVTATLLGFGLLASQLVAGRTSNGLLSFDLQATSGTSIKGRHLEVEKEVDNAYNKYYVVSLYVGSNQKEIQFMIDTGSSWIWIPSQSCTTCNPNRLSSRYD